MIKSIDDIKSDQEYWYSCAYFKHSIGQLSKSFRETKPLKVKIKRNGENYAQIINSATGSCICHPSYMSFNTRWEGSETYFLNYIFETEKEAWDSYYSQIQAEIERTKDLCEKRVAIFSNLLKGSK